MAKTRHIPERRCVACGQRFPKTNLVRVVRTPQGTISIDPSAKSPGRGAYLCTTSDCWRRGLTKGNLDRSLAVSISAEDRDQIMNYYLQNIVGSSVATQ